MDDELIKDLVKTLGEVRDATPFFATEYTFDHLSLDPSLRGNITFAYYEAGHMMYPS